LVFKLSLYFFLLWQDRRELFAIKVIQKDNRLEFLGEFDSYLKKKNIKHVFIYPRYLKINAYIERQNRILEDEFVCANEDLTLTSVDEFNKKLID
jgi:hypothetical protein